jgi:hypothetical protein
VEETMPEPSAKPLPLELIKAFSKAVLSYNDWNPGKAEREIKMRAGKSYSISSICGLVEGYTDLLPDRDFDQLYSYMHDDMHIDLKAVLIASPSYATGALCLRTMIERANEKRCRIQ